MQINSEQSRILAEWVRRKAEHHACQLCQSTHWRVGELLLSPDRDAANHNSAAMAQWICQNCGQVLLFDVNCIPQWQTVDTMSDLM